MDGSRHRTAGDLPGLPETSVIAVAFLICALSPVPAMAFTPGYTDGPIQARHMLASSEFVSYVHGKTGKLLVVGGDPTTVTSLREAGLHAFGALTKDRWDVTRWHAVAEPMALPFHLITFGAVYWLDTNPDGDRLEVALRDVASLIVPQGLLLFDWEQQTAWASLLKSWDWELLPFKSGSLHIWQKPYPQGMNVFILGKAARERRWLDKQRVLGTSA